MKNKSTKGNAPKNSPKIPVQTENLTGPAGPVDPVNRQDEFFKDFTELIKKHGVSAYSLVADVHGQQMVVYHPDINVAALLFNKAYKDLRSRILRSIGES